MDIVCKKLNLFFLLVALVIASCEKKPDDRIKDNDVDLSQYVTVQNECGTPVTSTLFAAKTTEAGSVTVEKNPDGTIRVTYQLLPGFYMIESHLSVTTSLEAVPQSNQHNPQVGLFAYKMHHNPAVDHYVYDTIPGGDCYIMAHAVVAEADGYKTDMAALDIELPSVAKIMVTYPSLSGESYFSTTVTEGGILDGIYDGWCVDVDNAIYTGVEYVVKVYSSYNEDIADPSATLVDFPENLGMVNWIINQDYVGKESPGGYGIYTFGDVQRAIWELVDSFPSTSGLGVWSQDRVDEIREAAAQPGTGEVFIPECGQQVAVMLVPLTEEGQLPAQITVAQITILNFDLVCQPMLSNPESAWAAGKDFGGPNWAKYFYFCY
ncbi:MAG TPA: hypothetical protein PLE95_00045 [Bacteroidales bacterium]|nr:hypothetical protein [Bacteroidales bacterium]